MATPTVEYLELWDIEVAQVKRYQPKKQYYLRVGDKVFSDSDLANIRRIKHNYKTSPHFKGVFISPIFDSGVREPPMWAYMGGRLWQHKPVKL